MSNFFLIDTNCGGGSGSIGNASGIAIAIEAKKAHSIGLHQDLVIEHNYISRTMEIVPPTGIYIGNSTNVQVHGNKLVGYQVPITTNFSENVGISDNNVE